MDFTYLIIIWILFFARATCMKFLSQDKLQFLVREMGQVGLRALYFHSPIFIIILLSVPWCKNQEGRWLQRSYHSENKKSSILVHCQSSLSLLKTTHRSWLTVGTTRNCLAESKPLIGNIHSTLGKIFSRWHSEIFFSRKYALTFHANCLRRWFAWNVKTCFLRKIRKISICRLLNMHVESGKG